MTLKKRPSRERFPTPVSPFLPPSLPSNGGCLGGTMSAFGLAAMLVVLACTQDCQCSKDKGVVAPTSTIISTE